jgi:hypothetical protein
VVVAQEQDHRLVDGQPEVLDLPIGEPETQRETRCRGAGETSVLGVRR